MSSPIQDAQLTKPSHVEKWSNTKRTVSVVTASLECLLFCGIIFGWPGISYVYEQNCYFIKDGGEYPCPTENNTEATYLVTTCTPKNLTNIPSCVIEHQQLQLATVLQRSVQGFILTVFFCGLFYDKFGTRLFRFLVSTLFIIGCGLFTQATRGSEILLFYAGPLVQIGGMATYTSNLKIASLFPKYQGTLIAFVNGALEASACTFLVAKILYQYYDLEPTTFWWIWLCLAVPLLNARTALFMPKIQIREKLDELEEVDQKLKRSELDEEQEKAAEENAEKKADAEANNMNFFHHVLSWQYFLHVFWMFLLDFWNITFIGLFSSWCGWLVSSSGSMTDLTTEELGDKSTWTNIWGVYQFVGAPMAMVVGMIMDRTRTRVLKATGDKRLAQLQSTALVLAITALLGAASAMLASQKNQPLQWVTFTLQLTFRACLYGNNAAALLMLYPPALFGKLYGVTMLFTFGGAEMGPLILKYIQDESSFDDVYKIISILLLFSLIYPVYLYKYVKA